MYRILSQIGLASLVFGVITVAHATGVSTNELSILKEGPSTAKPGDTFTYTLTVHNNSGTGAKNVRIGDNLPGELEYQSGSTSCTDGGTIWCNVGDLAADQNTSVQITVRVRDHAACHSTIANTGDVHSDNLGSAWNTAHTTIECDNTPDNPRDVQISKTDHRDEVNAGDHLTYDITVTNPTDREMAITVRDSFPNGTDVLHVSHGGQNNGGEAIWTDLHLNAHEQKVLQVEIRVHSNVENNHILQNTAQVDGGNSATDTTRVRSTGNVNDLHIEVFDNPDPIEPDEQLHYNIRVTNQGQGRLEDVSVTQALPTQIRFISATDGGRHRDGVITWDNIDIDGFSTRSFNVSGELTGSVRTNDILFTTVRAGNAQREEHTTVFDPFDSRHEDNRNRRHRNRNRNARHCNGAFELHAIDSHDPVSINDHVEYRIDIHNPCSIETTTDIGVLMDNGTTFVSASDNGRRSGDQVTWRRFFLHPGETRTVTFTVQVQDHAADQLRMHVKAGVGDTVEFTTVHRNNTVTPSTSPVSSFSAFVQQATAATTSAVATFRNRITPGVTRGFENIFDGNDRGLRVTKMSDKEEARPGDHVNYTIVLENHTGEDVQNVWIEDVFTSTPWIRIVEPGIGTPDVNNVIRWHIDFLSNGDSRTYTYTAQVQHDTPHMTEISNDVYVEAEGTGGVSGCIAEEGQRCIAEGARCVLRTGADFLAGEVQCARSGRSVSVQSNREMTVEKTSATRSINGRLVTTETETRRMWANGQLVSEAFVERVDGQIVNERVTGDGSASIYANTTHATEVVQTTSINLYSVGYWHMIHVIRHLPQTGVMAALLNPTDSPFIRPYKKSSGGMNPMIPVAGTVLAGLLAAGGIVVVRRKIYA